VDGSTLATQLQRLRSSRSIERPRVRLARGFAAQKLALHLSAACETVLGSPAAWGAAAVTLPTRIRAECQRILDREARLLAERLDRDAAVATSGGDSGALDDGADQLALAGERDVVPIAEGVQGDIRTEGAP